MTRINTNVSSLNAQKSLARTGVQLQEALTRLSTGLRINVGKDDPAGLIGSEVLRSDIVSTQKAISNSERANQMIATADSALGQVNSLLNDIRALITEAANSGAMSDEQIAANQLQIDSSLEAINRIAQTTTFQGRKLLDGSLGFTIKAGFGDLDTVKTLEVQQANLGAKDETTGVREMVVNVAISAAAAQAKMTATVDDDTGLADSLVIRLSGANGSHVFNFAKDTSLDDMVAAINLYKDATGVQADGDTADTLTLTSTEYGSKAFVNVNVLSEGDDGTFASSLLDATLETPAYATRSVGADIEASVNGVAATGDGNTLSINTATLAMSATVDDGDDTAFSFTITGGGALFQLGPDVVSNQQSRIGIQSVDTGNLGGPTGRLYEVGSGQAAALATDPTTAAAIVDEAITSVTALRGRLGAFQKTTIDSNVKSLTDTLENLTSAESSIRDADFAAETANLTRAQVLSQSGMAVLSIANSQPQNVLALLRNL